MNVFIFANCQGSVLHYFIPASYTVTHRNNYAYIYNTTLDDEIRDLLSNCDFFIYQPLSSVYPVYNTPNLLTFIKPSCKTISFPYIFNDAFTPIYKSFDYNINGEYPLSDVYTTKYVNIDPISKLKQSGLTLEAILELYDNNKIDFEYEKRFNRTIKLLQEKELHCDIKVSDFIIQHKQKYKLFNYHNLVDENITFCNHPSNILINYYCNKILDLMDLPNGDYNGDELLIATTLVSRYDIAYYKYDWIQVESEQADPMIKKIISEIYGGLP